MPPGRVILGIDIGSTKIATVVGVVDSSRGLVLRAINVKPTEAIARGTVRDLNQAALDIDESFSGAMYSSGLTAESVFVGVTGPDLASDNFHAEQEVTTPDGEITAEAIEEMVRRSMPARLPEGHRIVQSLVRHYTLDGARLQRSPQGMIGRRLGVETHIVTGPESQIANLDRALSRVHLHIQSYVLSLVAAGEAVLTEEEKNAGCILIDFGGGSTNVGVFHNGTLAYSACIPVGGLNYDTDLKQGLGVSFEEAQRIKKSYGKAWLETENEELDDFIDVKYYGRREYDKVKRRRVFEIMQPRTEELTEYIQSALEQSGYLERVAGGVVIVGGASQLRQLRQFLQRHLGRQVRLGLPAGIGHVLDEYRSPAYAATLGLLVFGAKYEEPGGNPDTSFAGEVWEAFRDMVRKLWRRLFDKQDHSPEGHSD